MKVANQNKCYRSADVLSLLAAALLAGCAGIGGREGVTPQAPAPSSTPATGVPETSAATESADANRYEQPGTYLDGLAIGGVQRAFVVHLPEGFQPGQPLPLVLNLHGAGSNALEQQQVSRWNDKADKVGIVVVSPQALGSPPVWQGVFLDAQGEADMAFFHALLDYLNEQLTVDPSRIYATGLSNGGTMVNRLGCDLSDTFAAIAPVAGAHSGLQLCEVERPVSVLAIHGTDDRIIPYLGNGSDIPSVRTWVSAWAARDGCADRSVESRPYPDVGQEVWQDCDEGVEVKLLAVEGGGHGWLGLHYEWDGTTFVTQVGATDAIWEFFEAHGR